jgi:hypothetical protein
MSRSPISLWRINWTWVSRSWLIGVTVGLAGAMLLLGQFVPGFGPSTAKGATASPYAFSQSESISRDFDVNGVQSLVDSRNFTVNVDQTSNLYGRQEIGVSWSGAHPTGGLVSDQNSIFAQGEEYPVVLLECRGVDSSTPPSGQQQLSPETCWTQNWSERYQDSYGDQYPPYRLDQYADSSDLQPIAGAPAQNPTVCATQGQYVPGDGADPPVQRWVPWVGADGTVYYGGNSGCGGEPPEANDNDTSALPSNETFGVTNDDANGDGSAEFDVLTSEQNETLGCSTTVACSLVVVPIMGIDCDVTSSTPAADVSQCEDTGYYPPGATMDVNNPLSELSVTGSLWWSASNWRNRISVPLTFATTSGSCSLTGPTADKSIDIYGSELMVRATDQWEPYFCLGDDNNDDYSMVHVQTGEPEARNLVASGGAEAAFTEFPQTGGYPVPTVNAPVAMTGFSIAYSISGTNGEPYQNLKLTPLLLAKLLTESYPDTTLLTQAFPLTGNVIDQPALASNPENITSDPEFEQLNPGVPQLDDVDAAAELISLSGDSDVIEALTTYINDDPAARAWLDGDSSGEPNACNSAGQYQAGATEACPAMAVNPAYVGMQLPVDQWPLLATPDTAQLYQSTWMQQNNPCLASSYPPGIPFLNQVASPVATLEDVAEDIQFDEPNSEVTCSQYNGSTTGEKLVADPREGAGNHFMLGVTPLADNYVYGLQSALLQTTPGNFVGPTTAALEATASLLKPDTTTGTWPIPYSQFETTAGQNAYPGTMIVYAAVPTEGLPKADAPEIGQILQFAATTGQQQGTDVGQLPQGYLPLTQADGLGGLAAYTEAAVADVTAQNGQLPSMTPASTPSPGNPSPSSITPTTSSDFGNGSYDGGPSASTTTVGSHTSGRSTRHGANSVVTLTPIQAVAERIQNWLGFFGSVYILGFCLFGLVFVPLVLVAGRRRGRW